MSAQIPEGVPAAKGAICYCLDEFSVGPGSRARVLKLRDAVAALAPDYNGLAETFGRCLLPYRFKNPTLQQIVDHLNAYWFDPGSPTSFFPGVPVAKIYGEGVVKALELSLASAKAVAPLDSWWIVDVKEVELISFADRKGNTTIGPNVVLLIKTPRPPKIPGMAATPPWILGKKAQAYVTRAQGSRIVTQSVRDIQGT